MSSCKHEKGFAFCLEKGSAFCLGGFRCKECKKSWNFIDLLRDHEELKAIKKERANLIRQIERERKENRQFLADLRK